MDTLYCDHNIFLTKKQRYSLIKGHSVKCIGVNICVLNSKKFKSPKNFDEVFCVYNIIPKKNVFKVIRKTKIGFNLFLFNKKLKSRFYDGIICYFFSKIKKDNNVDKLLDIKDGGSEWLFLYEQEYKKNLIIFHKIQIQKIENLYESLV